MPVQPFTTYFLNLVVGKNMIDKVDNDMTIIVIIMVVTDKFLSR
jgi:hypothetical protein